jgi:hypothetical protein
VVDQNRLERQVDQPPLPLEPRILEVLPARPYPRVGDQPGDIAVPINQLQGKLGRSARLQAPRWLGSSNRPAAASSDQLFAIFARMDSEAAAYTAIDPVEMLVIVHNLRTDRLTDHQWLMKIFGGRLRRPCLKPKTNSQA